MADRDRPYMQFNFLVSIGDGTDPGAVAAGFQEVSGIATELAVTEYRVGNAPHNNVIKLTGLNKATDVTLKRGVINPKVLFDWLAEIREGNTAARRTVTVELQSEDHRTVATWVLNEARPLKYSAGPYNAKGGDMLMEELTIAYERLAINVA
jgi:phage tail-like protein